MINLPVAIIHQVQLAIGGLPKSHITKGCQIGVGGDNPIALSIGDNIPKIACAIIGEQIMTDHVGVLATALNITANHGAMAGTVAKFKNGEGIVAYWPTTRRVVGMIAFITPPAVIFTAITVYRLEIYFFPGILPYITNPQITRPGIERGSPGVA